MDLKTLQPSIDALNQEIQSLTSARDTLLSLCGGSNAEKRKAPTLTAEGRQRLADSMRRRWALKKKQQRAAKGQK